MGQVKMSPIRASDPFEDWSTRSSSGQKSDLGLHPQREREYGVCDRSVQEAGEQPD